MRVVDDKLAQPRGAAHRPSQGERRADLGKSVKSLGRVGKQSSYASNISALRDGLPPFGMRGARSHAAAALRRASNIACPLLRVW